VLRFVLLAVLHGVRSVRNVMRPVRHGVRHLLLAVLYGVPGSPLLVAVLHGLLADHVRDQWLCQRCLRDAGSGRSGSGPRVAASGAARGQVVKFRAVATARAGSFRDLPARGRVPEDTWQPLFIPAYSGLSGGCLVLLGGAL
jgi:hypothetical protein